MKGHPAVVVVVVVVVVFVFGVCVFLIQQFGRLILSYICEFSPPSDLVVGHPNNSDFINLRNASL